MVKIVGGASAHDNQTAEAAYFNGQADLPIALSFAMDKAKELGIPLVMLPNVGSVGGPMDGTSTIARKIDSTVGPGKPGLVFVTGSSDDGGMDIHASASIAQGQSLDLQLEKLDAGSLTLEVWYPDSDRYDVTIQTPAGSLGPYVSPATNNATDQQSAAGISYLHQGSAVTSYGPVTRRTARIAFSGATGKYTVTLRAANSSGGVFHAWLNTLSGTGRFLSNVVPGYTVWDWASALNNIAPNDYVLREKWANLDGVVVGLPQDHVGDLWAGTGTGPTLDGRFGVDVSAPGNTVFAPFAPNTTWGVGSQPQDGNGLYSPANATSGASPQVTGIIALILEMNPTLDAKQVKDILQQTARADDYTGPVPNSRWGYGKIDALAAVTKASQMPGAKPYFSLDRNVISIDSPQGAPAPGLESVSLTPGNGASAFTTSSSATWLTVDKASGTAPSPLVIRATITGLALGDYDGEITIVSADGKAVPQSVMVHLHIRTAAPFITGVTDGAAFNPGFANGNWVTITGFGLANTTRIWTGADFNGNLLPTKLDGIQVSIQGKLGFPYFISPTQINVLAPDNTLTDTRFGITVFNNGVASNQFVGNARSRNPEFFRFDGRNIAGVHLDGALVGRTDLFPGLNLRPAAAGETIELFGTGCGATNPAVLTDRIVPAAAPATGTIVLTIGGKVAKTSFVGLSGSGLCQINAEVPQLPSGDAEVILQIDSFVSSDAAFINIK
jgi:uncharacterized protein (TIGR03437 family)